MTRCSTKSHRLAHPAHHIREMRAPKRDGGIQWPTFTGNTYLVGTSPQEVNVYYDPTLPTAGLANAAQLVAQADDIASQNSAIFGSIVMPVNVLIFAMGGATDGTGGADHMACSYAEGNNIEVCAAFGAQPRITALFEAELSECCMGGNLCGLSTGEALSRWCAAALSNNALADFATAPAWYADGENWVDTIDPSDQEAVSTGCGLAFISWLLALGFNLPAIAQAMVLGGDTLTLAALYAALTGETGAWSKFSAAVKALPGGVVDDDPFGAGGFTPAISQR